MLNYRRLNITNPKITELKENEIFVFGSNEAGYHNAGAARTALNFGAKMTIGIGISGQTYALPTKDDEIITLNIEQIKTYVDTLYDYIVEHPNLMFLITEIGCGLAGYKHEEIAPLFNKFITLNNVTLPYKFIKFIYNE